MVAKAAAFIAERAVPHGCRETAGAGATAGTRRSLSFPLDRPPEPLLDAPFRVSMSATDKKVFGMTFPMVQDSNPIDSEMTVNGLNLEELKEARAAAEDVKEAVSEAPAEVEEADETSSAAGAGIKDLLGK